MSIDPRHGVACSPCVGASTGGFWIFLSCSLPGVAALVPARMAQGLSGSDDSRPVFFLAQRALNCSDWTHWLVLPCLLAENERPPVEFRGLWSTYVGSD